MADPGTQDDLAGTELAHYEIGAKVGVGAMGSVYTARDRGLERRVAVKVLRREMAQDEDTVERFAQEARAAARLNHPNVTHIYFVGEQDGRRFFALEFVEGEDLETLVKEQGTLDLEQGIEVLVQVARGLRAAHQAGIVHRDVKPSNLIRRPDGTVKITDFGLSKAVDADVSSTQAGQILGTPTYMSPEQCRGEVVDHRTDVYSLGLVAWYLFTGQPAYPGPSVGAVINDQINSPLPRLSKHRDDLPPAIEPLLDALCAKKRDDRPADMAEVIERLEDLRPRDIEPAPIVARGTAVLIDIFVATLLSMALMQPLRWAGVAIDGESRLAVGIAGLTFTGIILLPELWYRTTLGKWLMHLAVLRVDGTRPSVRALITRFVVRFPTPPLWLLLFSLIPQHVMGMIDLATVLAMILGVATYFITKGRTLSDLLTHTQVVYRLPGEERRRHLARTF